MNLFTEVLPPASGQYVVTPIPYAPVVCTSPTTLSLSDDQVSAAIPIGFPFLFTETRTPTSMCRLMVL